MDLEEQIQQTHQNKNSQQRKPNMHKTSKIQHKYTFQVLIRAFPPNEEEQKFTRLHVLQNVLQAMQACDSSTCMIIPEDAQFQQRKYMNINPDLKNKAEYQKIENLLNIQTNGFFTGNVHFTSDTA
jgi:hypothetical protein